MTIFNSSVKLPEGNSHYQAGYHVGLRASPSVSYRLLMELRVDEQMRLLPIPEEVPIAGQEMSSVGDCLGTWNLEIFLRNQMVNF